MITNKERMENTTKLTFERRKEILQTYLSSAGHGPSDMTDIQKDELVCHLRELGYFPPMFDYAFRVLLSVADSKKRQERFINR